jgi:hypothetical protein
VNPKKVRKYRDAYLQVLRLPADDEDVGAGYRMYPGLDDAPRRLEDGIQVHKVITVSESKSSNVWIYDTVYTVYTWSPHTLKIQGELEYSAVACSAVE